MKVRAIIVSHEVFRERRRRLVRENGDYERAVIAAIDRGDGPYVSISREAGSFRWECPGCGHVYVGTLGSEPVSGWEEPRWLLSGSENNPTLEPSLGCPRWRDGECPDGHWWLRAGEMVAA